MSETPDPYVHGHHESVLRSHSSRTVENSAAYLVPHLADGIAMLDIGCGPGAITVEFGERIGSGSVIGIDPVSSVLQNAETLRDERGVTNVTFEPGDVYRLAFPDDHFDIVHAHQVVQHLSDPVRAISEMRRVCRPNGVVAVRDADYAAMTWAPAEPLLDRWLELYHEITRRDGAEADAGRYLLGWAQQAGFATITASSSTWTYATPSRRAWWGALWSDRVKLSNFASHVLDYGLADEDELHRISDAWNRWASSPDGFFAVVHGEILAVKDPAP